MPCVGRLANGGKNCPLLALYAIPRAGIAAIGRRPWKKIPSPIGAGERVAAPCWCNETATKRAFDSIFPRAMPQIGSPAASFRLGRRRPSILPLSYDQASDHLGHSRDISEHAGFDRYHRQRGLV